MAIDIQEILKDKDFIVTATKIFDRLSPNINAVHKQLCKEIPEYEGNAEDTWEICTELSLVSDPNPVMSKKIEEDSSSDLDNDEDLYSPKASNTKTTAKASDEYGRILMEIATRSYSSFKNPKDLSYSPVALTPVSESVNVIISDTHFGKKVIELYQNTLLKAKPYDMQIAATRLLQTCKEVVDQVKIRQRLGIIVDEINIILAGDIVDGAEIYPGQAENQETQAPLLQVMYAVDVVDQGSLLISKGCPNIPVNILCVPGNHGRTGNMQATKINNYDNFLYLTLAHGAQIRHSTQKNCLIKVDPTFVDTKLVEIKGHQVIIKHKGPAGTYTPTNNSKWGKLLSIYDWDIAILGHLHNPQYYEWEGHPIFQNGTTAEPDSYNYDDILSVSTPAQWIFGTSQEKPVTFMHLVSF